MSFLVSVTLAFAGGGVAVVGGEVGYPVEVTLGNGEMGVLQGEAIPGKLLPRGVWLRVALFDVGRVVNVLTLLEAGNHAGAVPHVVATLAFAGVFPVLLQVVRERFVSSGFAC